ncbi:kinase-like protein [Aspergillus insuetus]
MMPPISGNDELSEYTSGRFLFNEELRLAERRIHFDMNALARAACHSGGFNCVLQITFKDGYAVLARLPYKTTVPTRYAVASEPATLALLRAHGAPVPKVLTYSPYQTNAVGTEYIILEKHEGIPLRGEWFSMDTKTRSRFMSINFLASGSLYHRHDLDNSHRVIPVSDDIVVGPTAQHEWWYQERAALEVDRGPWNTFSACFEAPAKRKIEFCKRFGKPRLHVQRYLRELHQFHRQSSIPYQHLLAKYLKLAPYPDVPAGHRMPRPTLRHPDFSLNNILVNTSSDVVGIIDWQHVVILPLCLCAEIPNHFQNLGDPLPEEQKTVRETMRRRIVHFYYAALTMKSLPDHFTMSQVLKNWPMSLNEGAQTTSVECPVHLSEEEIQKCSEDYHQEQEKLQELGEMRDLIGTDALGWVPDEAELETHSSTEMEKTAIISHFPFDDHEENT